MTETADAVRAAAVRRGWTVAVAESLTGGAVLERLVGVPGASAYLRGGVVAYAADLKASLLGVPAVLLDVHGAVDPGVAVAMAEGVRRACGSDVGAATTGVAGPGAADGHPAGEYHLAVVSPTRAAVRCVRPRPGLAAGSSDDVRRRLRAAARDDLVALLLDVIG